MCKFKAKDSYIKLYSLCVCNTLKSYTIDTIKKTGLKGCFSYAFPVGCIIIDTNNIWDVHKYLMKINEKK